MPTYEFQCESGHTTSQYHSMGAMPDKVPCETKLCGKIATRILSGGGGVIFKGRFPGQALKRETEDKKVFEKAKIGRRLKRSGKVPADAVLKLEDIDVDKYHGPEKLPPGHPEGVPALADPSPKDSPG
jgi:predicted nucleic acid-binding Zn ribbon protein